MAQADGVVANGTGSAVRSDINGQYAALWSNHSGSTEPSSGKVAYQFWADTNTNILKIRNSANNGWINLFTLTGGIDVDAASNFNEDVTFVGDSSKNAVWDKSDGALEFADNAKCTFGAGDLAVYHDGQNRIRSMTTGQDLYIAAEEGEIYIQTDFGTSNSIACLDNGAVNLYFDNALKIQTTSDGAKVSGELLIEGDTKRLFIKDTGGTGNSARPGIVFQDSAATNQFFVGNGASDSTDFYLQNYLDAAIIFKTDNTDRLKITNGGNLQIPNDSGKIELGASQDLQIYSNGTRNIIDAATSQTTHFYYNGAQQFFFGSSEFKGLDNKKIKLGTGDDFQMWFDGTDMQSNQVAGSWTHSVAGTEIWETQADRDFFIRADLRAWINDSFDVGKPDHRWDDIYATNGTISTSDRNEKNTIVESDLGLSFVNKLKPVSYKFNGKTRTHYGLIAQDIETILSDISKSSTDFAGFIKTTLTKDEYTKEDLETPKDVYGLRYNEFIAPLIKAVQELSAEVDTLKTKVAALEAK